MSGDNKLTFDPLTHLPELRIDHKFNQVVPWSLHTFPENFMQSVQPFSCNFADKEANK